MQHHIDTALRLQVLGTHNSYHIAPSFAISNAWKYSHIALTSQLDAGVRSLVRMQCTPLGRALGGMHGTLGMTTAC